MARCRSAMVASSTWKGGASLARAADRAAAVCPKTVATASIEISPVSAPCASAARAAYIALNGPRALRTTVVAASADVVVAAKHVMRHLLVTRGHDVEPEAVRCRCARASL